jgi:hypothetical protein
MIHVILLQRDGTVKKKRLYKSSIKPARNATVRPASYSEAVLQQCPEVELKMESLCRELARCKIFKDADGIHQILNQKLQEATQRQDQLRGKALYYDIQF